MSLLRRIEKGGGSGGSGGGDDGDERRAARKAAQQRRAAAARPDSGGRGRETAYMDLKNRVQNKLLNELDQSLDITRKDEVRRQIEELFNAILAEESMVLSRAERHRLFESIVADILGLGPLEPLLADDTVTEIMVNGPKNIFVE
ncbi:MAG: CpaF family protein, partial [Chloroflexi bacterium]